MIEDIIFCPYLLELLIIEITTHFTNENIDNEDTKE
jgi:hypothetical protein